MQIFKSRKSSAIVNPLTIYFILDPEDYKPYARKLLSLNNDPYMGNRLFDIEVVERKKLDNLITKDCDFNVIVRIIDDSGDQISYATTHIDFSKSKKEYFPDLKDFISQVYEKDIANLQKSIDRHHGIEDREKLESLSEIINFFKKTCPRVRNDSPVVFSTCPKLLATSYPDENHKARLYTYKNNPKSEFIEQIISLAASIKQKKKDEERYDENVIESLISKILDYNEDSLEKAPEEESETEETNESPLSEEAAKDCFVEIIPYRFNKARKSCDFYIEINRTASILSFKNNLAAYIYGLTLLLRKHNCVLKREELQFKLPLDEKERTPEQKWFQQIYEILLKNRDSFKNFWKRQIEMEIDSMQSLNNAIGTIRREVKKLFENSKVESFVSLSDKRLESDKRRVDYYYVNIPPKNILIRNAEIKKLVNTIPESLLIQSSPSSLSLHEGRE